MIEKIFDYYYTKKLCRLINEISLKYLLSKKYTIKKGKLIFSVKLPEYNDKQYKQIISIDTKDIFAYMCDYQWCKKDIEGAIDGYIEYIKNYKGIR